MICNISIENRLRVFVSRMEKNIASSGNRTRAARVAGEHSTTEPTMLDIVEENKTEAAGNLAKLN